MEKQIVLLSKDAFGIMNLPLYGNAYWKTPNIDALAEKGTIFMRQYTGAPSTAMAITTISTGKYPYELADRSKYEPVQKYDRGDTIFDILEQQGYANHFVWDEEFQRDIPYENCFGKNDTTVFHNLQIFERVGVHKKNMNPVYRNDEKTKYAMDQLCAEVDSILNSYKKVFIWIHLPHVIAGRTGYGSDVDLVDEFVGWLRNRVGDQAIYFTGDHGHMNMVKGKIGYAFDVAETAIRVPLITPRIGNETHINYPTSHVDLRDIILTNTVKKRDYVIVDSQYYAQLHRKMAIISGRFKYEFNKYDGKEFLYDVCDDFHERRNLLIKQKYDVDRQKIMCLSELFFSPYEKEAEEIFPYLRSIKDSIWRSGDAQQERKELFREKLMKPKLYLIRRKQEHRYVKDFTQYER